ncbi:MAG TPA: hypothetical protein VK738_04420 [Terriglobales bacterium]|jgi:hypothetical protein|nr:hypothetical protein [Terriglobales bacterium]
MPNYSNASPPFAIYPGDSVTLFNNENPTPPQASQQVAIGNVYGTDDVGVSVLITYASAPASVQVDVQIADTDADLNYFSIFSSSNTAGENVNLNVQRHKFLRVKKVSQSGGGAVTAVVSR